MQMLVLVSQFERLFQLSAPLLRQCVTMREHQAAWHCVTMVYPGQLLVDSLVRGQSSTTCYELQQFKTPLPRTPLEKSEMLQLSAALLVPRNRSTKRQVDPNAVR